MEEVIIDLRLIKYNDTQIDIELRMLNATKTEVKAIMWSTFDHFNLIQQKREVHSEELLKLFKKVKKPVVEKQFEERIAVFKRQRQ